MDDRSSVPGFGSPSADGPAPSMMAAGDMIQQALEEARRIWEQQARDREAKLDWQRVRDARNAMIAAQCGRLSREKPSLSRDELERIVKTGNRSGNPAPYPTLPEYLIDESQEMLPMRREKANWCWIESDHRLSVTGCRVRKETTHVIASTLRRVAESEQMRSVMAENPALSPAAARDVLAARARAGNPAPFPPMLDIRSGHDGWVQAASWDDYWGIVGREREDECRSLERALQEFEAAMRILQPVMEFYPNRTVEEALALIFAREDAGPPESDTETRF